MISFILNCVNSFRSFLIFYQFLSVSCVVQTIGMDVIRLKFGDILRDLLEERNLSQKQLADDLNISASAVGNYVRNNREPDFETLKKIAGYFQVTTDFLLNYQSDQVSGYGEQKILQIFRALTEDQKELFLDQGKVLLRHRQNKRGRSSLSEAENEAV